jgi:hypothetical protein
MLFHIVGSPCVGPCRDLLPCPPPSSPLQDTVGWMNVINLVLMSAMASVYMLSPTIAINTLLAVPSERMLQLQQEHTIRTRGEGEPLIQTPLLTALLFHLRNEPFAPKVLGLRVTPTLYRLATAYSASAVTYLVGSPIIRSWLG